MSDVVPEGAGVGGAGAGEGAGAGGEMSAAEGPGVVCECGE